MNEKYLLKSLQDMRLKNFTMSTCEDSIVLQKLYIYYDDYFLCIDFLLFV